MTNSIFRNNLWIFSKIKICLTIKRKGYYERMEMEELVSISGFLLISKCTNEMKFYNCPSVLWEIKRRYVSQWDKKEGKDLWNGIVRVLIRRGRTCPSQNAEPVNISTSSDISSWEISFSSSWRLVNREKTISFLHFTIHIFLIFVYTRDEW